MNSSDFDLWRFLRENPQLRQEATDGGRLSEYAANKYKNWLVKEGKLSRFDAAEEKRRRSVRG